MKKIICAIAVIMVLSVITVCCLSGCSNVAQTSKLQATWSAYERSVFSVNKGDVNVGTLVVTLKVYKTATKVTVGGGEYDLTGTLMNYDLGITAGENAGDSIAKTVAVNSDLSPVASYVQRNLSGVYSTALTTYNGNKVTLSIDGGEGKTFKSKSPCYDNDMLYHVVRASGIFNDGYSISFNVPDNNNGGMYSVSGSQKADSVKVQTGLGEQTGRTFTLTATTDLGSFSTNVTYAKFIVINEDVRVVKPIIKIEEGDYSYVLQSISVTEPAA